MHMYFYRISRIQEAFVWNKEVTERKKNLEDSPCPLPSRVGTSWRFRERYGDNLDLSVAAKHIAHMQATPMEILPSGRGVSGGHVCFPWPNTYSLPDHLKPFKPAREGEKRVSWWVRWVTKWVSWWVRWVTNGTHSKSRNRTMPPPTLSDPACHTAALKLAR